MGEEVREPERTIPRAILTALTVVIVIYMVVGISILIALSPAGVAASRAPLAAAVDAAGWVWASLLVRAGRGGRGARRAARVDRRHQQNNRLRWRDTMIFRAGWPPSMIVTRCRIMPTLLSLDWYAP